MDKKAYIISKKYTDETAIQFGGLKGANCKIKSVVKQNGQNIVTFEWKNDDGDIRESQMTVDDGTPIYIYQEGTTYKYGNIVIYEAQWFMCTTEHVAGPVLDPTKFEGIGTADGNYGIVSTVADLPTRFTPADKKLFFVISESTFYLWNGVEWKIQIQSIPLDEIDDLFV